MSTFRLRSHTRVPRSVQLEPELDRWIEGMSTLWGCSLSEAMNRLLKEQMQLREQLGGTFATERGEEDGTSQVVHVLLERFKEDICRGMDRLGEEVSKVKSNLYLLQSMHDRHAAIALGGQKYDAWRTSVQELLTKKGNKS